jgi:3',5'-cyclic AMP phosphodiesterase CpdA
VRSHWGFKGPPNPDAGVTLKKAVAAVNALATPPDFIVFSGDLTHRPLLTWRPTLRRLFVIDEIVIHHRGRMRLNSDICEVDIWTVEQFVANIERNIRERPSAPPSAQDRIDERLFLLTETQLGQLETFSTPWLLGWAKRFESRISGCLGYLVGRVLSKNEIR